ncbi:MAG TPA: hypothetical protein PK771_12905, partial [Spirochaetota bacterium]|nr:hypothetical protein [Spirochaetota bacterium]
MRGIFKTVILIGIIAMFILGCSNPFVSEKKSDTTTTTIEEINKNNGISGIVKIPGLKDAENCVVTVEKQINMTMTASVFN